ncbi:MAG: nitroreductase family deazaflavin-dependent oxidoreductase [Mycobacteriales bacterium]
MLSVEGPVGRAVQRVAGLPFFAGVAGRVMPPVDRGLSRLTGGRLAVSQLLVPTLVITTTGAKSGLPRTTPLATLPDGDAFYVVGSNFGGGAHPGWSANLLKTPEATVTYRGRTTAVRAHLLDEQEKAAVWPRLLKIWPTYDRYVERSGRNLRVFRLDPVRSAQE